MRYAIALFLLFVSATAVAESPSTKPYVAVALVLATDTSCSITESSYKLKREGIAAAFETEEMQLILKRLKGNTIAVQHMPWHSRGSHFAQGWFLIHDEESAQRFANHIRATERPGCGATGVTSALAKAFELIQTMPFESDRRVIDISADGTENDVSLDHKIPDEGINAFWARSARTIRNYILLHDITINAITIVQEEPNVTQWFRENVIGGTFYFARQVSRYEDFGIVFRQKLSMEVSGAKPPVEFTTNR